jgi:alanine racemase
MTYDLSFHNDQLRITIDLKKIQNNYKKLCEITKGQVGYVCKANSYSLGAVPLSKAIYTAGCRSFFVATIQEGIHIRKALPEDAKIYILHGPDQNDLDLFMKHNLIPVLNNFHQITLWSKKCQKDRNKLQAVLHFDTGMNRLGLSVKDIDAVKEETRDIDIVHVMSHLACASELDNTYNLQQKELFQKVIKIFPGVENSLVAAEGISLGSQYFYDMARVGIGLYGILPHDKGTINDKLDLIFLPQAKIIQTREVEAGTSIGYGKSYTTKKKTRLAVIGIGFADGLPRSASNNAELYIQEFKVPIVGRISMDLTIIDVTDVPKEISSIGCWVDIIQDSQTFNKLSEKSGRSIYELMALFTGVRYNRIYKN